MGGRWGGVLRQVGDGGRVQLGRRVMCIGVVVSRPIVEGCCVQLGRGVAYNCGESVACNWRVVLRPIGERCCVQLRRGVASIWGGVFHPFEGRVLRPIW